MSGDREPAAGLVVRPARPKDLGAIMALERALFSAADRFSARLYRRFMRAAPDLVLVAEVDGVVVGCVAGGVESGDGRIQTLGVDAAARGRGIGRALVERLLGAFADRGLARAALEVRVGNAPAIALYRSLGFAPAGALPAYYADGEDGLLMLREGSGAPDRPAAVLDTNVFVAAGFRRSSHSAGLLEAVRDGRLRMVWNEATRREVEHVLRRIPPLSWERVEGLFRAEDRYPGRTHPERLAHVTDPADRHVAALADASGAALVTSDEHLLRGRDRADAPILTPGEFARGHGI